MIHQYRVRNFKSIRDVSVDFEPVTVLVGRSGVGKSNLIESIQFLRTLLLQGIQVLSKNSPSGRKVWFDLCHLSKMAEPLSFDVEFSIKGITERFRYSLNLYSKAGEALKGLKGGEVVPNKIEESLRLGDELIFHQKDSQWIKKPSVNLLPKAGCIALGSIPSVSDIVIAHTALTSGIGSYDFTDAVLTNGEFKAANAGLNDDASNYLGVLQDITKNLQDLQIRRSMISTLQRVNPTIATIELNKLEAPNKVFVVHSFASGVDNVTLDLSQESAGIRRFYAHLLALYQRPPKQTVCFEHPEDGIHPGAMSLLAEEIKSCPAEGRGQVVLTTHNPMLLNEFAASQIRVVEMSGAETKIGTLSTEQVEALSDDLLDAGELLTTDPARIDRTEQEPSAS